MSNTKGKSFYGNDATGKWAGTNDGYQIVIDGEIQDDTLVYDANAFDSLYDAAKGSTAGDLIYGLGQGDITIVDGLISGGGETKDYSGASLYLSTGYFIDDVNQITGDFRLVANLVDGTEKLNRKTVAGTEANLSGAATKVETLNGYEKVTIGGGATVKNIYSGESEEVFKDDEMVGFIYSLADATAANINSKLTVSDSTIGFAFGFQTVEISNTKFDTIFGGEVTGSKENDLFFDLTVNSSYGKIQVTTSNNVNSVIAGFEQTNIGWSQVGTVYSWGADDKHTAGVEIAGVTSIATLNLRNSDVTFTREGILTLTNIYVSGGVSSIFSPDDVIYKKNLLWGSSDYPTVLSIDDNATLQIERAHFDEFIKADIITIKGELSVLGDVDNYVNWSVLQNLTENHTINTLSFECGVSNFHNVNILSKAAFTINAREFVGTSGNDFIKIGENANITFGGDIVFGGGKDTVTVGSNSELSIVGDVLGASKVTVNQGKTYKNINNVKVQNWTQLSIDGNLTGTKGDTLTVGAFSIVYIGKNYGVKDVDNVGKITVGTDASFSVGNNVYGVSSMTLADGKTYVKNNEKTVQGITGAKVGGTIFGSEKTSDFIKTGKFTDLFVGYTNGIEKITIGAYSNFNAKHDVVGIKALNITSGGVFTNLEKKKVLLRTTVDVEGKIVGTTGKDVITIGSFVDFNSGDIDFVDNFNAIKIGSDSTFKVDGSIYRLNNLTSADSKAYKITDGEFFGKTIVEVTGTINGTGGNDVIKTGKLTGFKAGNIVFGSSGKSSITVGRESDFVVLGKIENVNNINVLDDATFSAYLGIKSINDNNRITFGKRVSAFSGMVEYTYYKSAMTIGTDTHFEVAGHYVAEVGSKVAVYKVNNLTLNQGSGPYNENFWTGDDTVRTVAIFDGDVIGTEGNGKINVGKNTKMIITGSLDMRSGTDYVSVVGDSYLRINGFVKDVEGAKFGNRAYLEISTQAITGFGKYSQASGAKVYDIGDVGVAKNFIDIVYESSDDHLTAPGTSVVKVDEETGWLSNKAAYINPANKAQVSTYEDLADFFKVGTSAGLSIEDWQVSGATDKLKVSVYSYVNMQWVETVVTETKLLNGKSVWTLDDDQIIGGATDYRVAVQIADNANNKGIFGYQVANIA